MVNMRAHGAQWIASIPDATMHRYVMASSSDCLGCITVTDVASLPEEHTTAKLTSSKHLHLARHLPCFINSDNGLYAFTPLTGPPA